MSNSIVRLADVLIEIVEISTHLNMLAAVARHNFKSVKIQLYNLVLQGLVLTYLF